VTLVTPYKSDTKLSGANFRDVVILSEKTRKKVEEFSDALWSVTSLAEGLQKGIQFWREKTDATDEVKSLLSIVIF
jgi:hypothetical protein